MLLIIAGVARRIHVSRLWVGEIILDSVQAHHARDVLRLPHGAAVEVFDNAGAVADGVLLLDDGSPRVRVESVIEPAQQPGVRLTVASAVPKGDRADWMVEKLSELGVYEWVPLAAARSVVLPEGKSKFERWARIATEGAKQSRRAGVMRIGSLTPVQKMLEQRDPSEMAWCLSTAHDATPANGVLEEAGAGLSRLTAFIGPEGDWAKQELAEFAAAGAREVSLTTTVLRVETAAITVAAVVAVGSRGRT